jgi:tripartite-type tricarboxylate transporter receptor subunit TctC
MIIKSNSWGSVIKNHISKFSTAAVFFVFLFFVQAVLAADQAKFPAKPIKIIVPAGAGGSLGQETRLIAPTLQKQLGVSIPIEYVTGAEGMIAYNKFQGEKSDGYSLICFNLASAIALELTRETAKYNVKSYTPIAVHNVKNFVLVVNPDRWKSLDEFLREAKQNKVSMAATGGSADFQGHLFETAAGLKLNWVPYTSAAEGMAAVAGKHVDAMLTFPVAPRPMINSGKLRALVVFSNKPDPILPGVPDMKSLGHNEIPLLLVYGILAAPPKTPPKIVAILEKAVNNTCGDPEFIKLADKAAIMVAYRSAADLTKLVAQDYELLTKYKQFLK